MAQGLFAGSTNYKIQSLQDILEDIENWLKLNDEIEKFTVEQCSSLQICKYWNKIPYNFQSIIKSSIFYFKTIRHDLSIVKNAIKRDNITEREVSLVKTIGYNAAQYNIKYGIFFKEDLRNWRDYNDYNFKRVENIYNQVRDYFITLQDASNIADRLRDYMSKTNLTNNINIGDNAKEIFIQQETVHSLQQNVKTNYNKDQVQEVLYKIDKLLESNMNTDNNDYFKTIRMNIAETMDMAERKEEKSKIKKALERIKQLSSNIAETIIAEQIITLLMKLFESF